MNPRYLSFIREYRNLVINNKLTISIDYDGNYVVEDVSWKHSRALANLQKLEESYMQPFYMRHSEDYPEVSFPMPEAFYAPIHNPWFGR